MDSKCPLCGGEVKDLQRGNRFIQHRFEHLVEIPPDFIIPTCLDCGKRWLTEEQLSVLDQLVQGEA